MQANARLDRSCLFVSNVLLRILFIKVFVFIFINWMLFFFYYYPYLELLANYMYIIAVSKLYALDYLNH
jgi:hypothetical protein